MRNELRLDIFFPLQVISSTPPAPLGKWGDNNKLPLDPIFLVIFDQFIAPEKVLETISIHSGSNLDWKKDPAPYASLRLVERDSKELEEYVHIQIPYLVADIGLY